MITKIMATVAICGVILLTGYEYFQAIQLQARFASFVNKGARFTAQDGARERDERRRVDHELCERIQNLERYSYGFRDVGKVPMDCNYTLAP